MTIPFGIIQTLNDYSSIVNEILKEDVSLTILKFSTDSSGVKMLLDLPKEKVNSITESLKSRNILVNRKGRVSIDKEKCVNCGGCISLCPTEALQFDANFQLEFSEDKCIGCNLCLDSCPRQAIEQN
ncbi:MAG: 4Fe-4S binding protein [Candidatus Lokiarchaeota archaeon]|nr:4Fe-4S binding protein [Candidatus Lokiarchaeota archaeon]